MLKIRPCGPIVSGKNPTALSKRELVDLAVIYLDKKQTSASKMTMSNLCDELIKVADKINIDDLIPQTVSSKGKFKKHEEKYK